MYLQKEYRRDLEREIVGKGMELSAEVLEIQRAKRASDIQSQVTTAAAALYDTDISSNGLKTQEQLMFS